MSERRDFIKSSLLLAAGAAVGNSSTALASTGPYPSGVVYTARDAGKWAKKIDSHAPKISVTGDKVTIRTEHGMSNSHFIVRHTLVSSNGKVIGEKTFSPKDEEAVSVFKLKKGGTKKFYATSFCNKHDFWVTEFSL